MQRAESHPRRAAENLTGARTLLDRATWSLVLLLGAMAATAWTKPYGLVALIVLVILFRWRLSARLRAAVTHHGMLADELNEYAVDLQHANERLLVAMRERARMDRELGQARATEAVGKLARSVAHDCNNQLTIIESYTELLIAERTPDAAVGSCLEEIRVAARRAALLMRQVLSIKASVVREAGVNE